MAQQSGSDADNIVETFARFDVNGDGSIDAAELSSVLSALDPSWTEQKSGKLFKMIDANRDQKISYKEFVSWLFGHRFRREQAAFLKTLDLKADKECGVVAADEATQVTISVTLLSGEYILRDASFALADNVQALKRRCEKQADRTFEGLADADGNRLPLFGYTLRQAGVQDGMTLTAIAANEGETSFLTLRLTFHLRGECKNPDIVTRVDGGSTDISGWVPELERLAAERGWVGEVVDIVKPPSGATPPHKEYCKCGHHVSYCRNWESPVLNYCDFSGCHVRSGDALTVYLGKRGEAHIQRTDIGHFGLHSGEPGVDCLCSAVAGTTADAIGLLSILGGNPRACFQSFPCADVLSVEQRNILMHHLDEKHRGEADLKLDLTPSRLAELIGSYTVARLAHYFVEDFNQVKLRRCAAHGQCINFHTDVSKRTMQVALNGDDSYEGGRLTYVTAAGFMRPPRPAGSITMHENNILHGVSSLLNGVRYGLFLLQTPSMSGT